jgi:hypothetical protein
MNKETVGYIIDFLTLGNASCVFYGKSIEANPNAKVIIEQSSFWDNGIYGTENSLPLEPLLLFSGTPILFGKSEITKLPSGQIVLHADIVASSYFLLSRYEEFIRKDCRDIHGRFPGKESILFKAGYAQHPIVDEYGKLLRDLLHENGVPVLPETEGFGKIYLTHDVDIPFKYPSLFSAVKQVIKNIIKWKSSEVYSPKPIHNYFNIKDDEIYTFPKLITYDSSLKKKASNIPFESIYFIITAGSVLNNKYYNFNAFKVKKLLQYLVDQDSTLGLHVSYEGGAQPSLLLKEAFALQKYLKVKNGHSFYSRHHYLRWHEPEDIVYMEQAGITDDFTLAYADYTGFRCGTSRPYRFINPSTQELAKVIIHPLTIMECSLNASEYMDLDYKNALEYSRAMIDQVYKHNGDLILLWHNTQFLGNNFMEKLYAAVLEYIAAKIKGEPTY